MGETDQHFTQIINLVAALRVFFAEVPDPPLVRFRLTARGDYEREDGTRLDGAELGLVLSAEADGLRLYDAATGEKLLTPEEAVQARRAAEAEVARLRVELVRLRGRS